MLGEESVSFEAPALDVIARSAAGSMRDALSLTDQAIAYGQGALRLNEVTDMLGVVGRDEVATLLQALAAGSAAQLMAISAELAERSADFTDVLRGLMEALHAQSVDSALGRNSSEFTAEELQLYYQIALIGYRDINIAPDERSGFEMTLLRMLAFAPSPASKVPPRAAEPTDTDAPSAAPAASAPGLEQQDKRQQVSIAEQPQEARSKPAAPPSSVDDDLSAQWFDLVNKMQVGGVTRMIAEHSILQRLQPPDVELLLDEGHDTLLNAAQVEHLSRAMEELLGVKVRLQVHTGRAEVETPAARRERQARERQASAEHAIAADDKVQHLLSEFGGRVDEIRPV